MFFLQRIFPLFLALLLLLCLVALVAACSLGQYPIPFAESLRCIIPGQSYTQSTAYTIVQQIRLPRALAALLCGASLSLAGCLLQGVLRNPLADPFTLGISAGAACGASIAIAMSVHVAPIFPLPMLVPAGALTGSLLALVCALLLGHTKGGLSRENVILAGIAVASFLGAIVALVKALNEESVTSIVFWILGSFQGITWNSLPILSLAFIPGAAVALWGWRRLDALSLGDAEASSLGINPGHCRFLLLLGASAMTAGCVAVTGVIGFVGLVVPHILRLLLGGSHATLLLAAIPTGGLFLLLADTIARIILDDGQELPVGVVTALAGAPFFAFLIWQRPSRT